MKVGVQVRASIPSLSECDPGLNPSEFNVLVLPEVVEEKTAGGIILPDAVKDGKDAAGQRGRLVAVSPVAFDYATFPEGSKPEIGDIVHYAKFAGTKMEGYDGRSYRAIKDKDIIAVEV